MSINPQLKIILNKFDFLLLRQARSATVIISSQNGWKCVELPLFWWGTDDMQQRRDSHSVGFGLFVGFVDYKKNVEQT